MKALNLTPRPLSLARGAGAFIMMKRRSGHIQGILLVGAIALLLLTACIQVAPTPGPTGTPADSAGQPVTGTPTPVTPITREQAIQIALGEISIPQPEVSAVENPRNPVARLMTEAEYARARGAVGALHPDRLVWVVQFEGVSYSAGIGAVPPLRQLNYATVAIDAQSGNIIGTDYTYAPLL